MLSRGPAGDGTPSIPSDRQRMGGGKTASLARSGVPPGIFWTGDAAGRIVWRNNDGHPGRATEE